MIHKLDETKLLTINRLKIEHSQLNLFLNFFRFLMYKDRPEKKGDS